MRVRYVDSHQAASRARARLCQAPAPPERRPRPGSAWAPRHGARPPSGGPSPPRRATVPTGTAPTPSASSPASLDRARSQGGEHDGHRRLRDHTQAQRPRTLRGSGQALACQQRANGRHRLAHASQRPLPGDAVKALGQRRAAGPDTRARTRPPEQRCSPAAPRAMVAGVRPHTETIDVPRPMRDVRAASSASTISESCVQPSATSTRSRPMPSAWTARRAMTSSESRME